MESRYMTRQNSKGHCIGFSVYDETILASITSLSFPVAFQIFNLSKWYTIIRENIF